MKVSMLHSSRYIDRLIAQAFPFTAKSHSRASVTKEA